MSSHSLDICCGGTGKRRITRKQNHLKRVASSVEFLEAITAVCVERMVEGSVSSLRLISAG